MENEYHFKKKPRGVIVLVDDDKDEHELFRIVMKTMGITNTIVSFYSGDTALEHLRTTNEDVFMIICDIKMPRMDGLELKRMIEFTPEIRIKAIPFIYHSNSGSDAEIRTAYSQSIQGFLRKAPNIEETTATFYRLFSLWTEFIHPKDLSK